MADGARRGVGGSGTRPGSKAPGRHRERGRELRRDAPGHAPDRSVITQSVWPHSASVPSASRPSVRRRAQTLRNPVTAVETASVTPERERLEDRQLRRAHDPGEAAVRVPRAVEAQRSEWTQAMSWA